MEPAKAEALDSMTTYYYYGNMKHMEFFLAVDFRAFIGHYYLHES